MGAGDGAVLPRPFSFPQVYADYESNPQLRQAIEFACRQFYILHRKPFVLQLFASVAPLLEFPVSYSPALGSGGPVPAASPWQSSQGHSSTVLADSARFCSPLGQTGC